MQKKLLTLLVPVLVAGLLICVYALYQAERAGVFDERLQKALKDVQDPRFYEASVDTHTEISGRYIDISGRYVLDFTEKRFGSYGTTTLTIPEEAPKNRYHVFSLQNISVGNDIYVRIDTNSDLLRKAIPFGTEWRHFTSTTIPPEYVDIAVSGPVLDNLALLAAQGRYISLEGNATERVLGTTTYHVYSFRLSKKSAEVNGGTLQSFVDRIGEGSVEVWIDGTPRVRRMIVHGENYTSTTTILSINTPLTVSAPLGLE